MECEPILDMEYYGVLCVMYNAIKQVLFRLPEWPLDYAHQEHYARVEHLWVLVIR